MKRTITISILVALGTVAAMAQAQSRADAFDAQRVEVTSTVLDPLPDGGCAARWCGLLTSDDGGTTLRACTELVELRSATNQNRCAGLAAAGVPRIQRELRFPVDGGAP